MLILGFQTFTVPFLMALVHLVAHVIARLPRM